jgi:uncharacterized protein YegL
MSTPSTPAIIPSAAAGDVPKVLERYIRYPFLLLIDASGADGQPAGATANDSWVGIRDISRAVQDILRRLHFPLSNHLKDVHEGIDLAVVTYSESCSVAVPWTRASQAECPILEIAASGASHVCSAVTFAIAYADDRVRWYRSRNLNYASPTILHFSTGHAADLVVGDERWSAIRRRLSNVMDGADDPDRSLVDIRNLVARGAIDTDRSKIKSHHRRTIAGPELLTLLCGDDSTFALDDHPHMLPELVEFVTNLVARITSGLGATQNRDLIARECALATHHIRPARDLLGLEGGPS